MYCLVNQMSSVIPIAMTLVYIICWRFIASKGVAINMARCHFNMCQCVCQFKLARLLLRASAFVISRQHDVPNVLLHFCKLLYRDTILFRILIIIYFFIVHFVVDRQKRKPHQEFEFQGKANFGHHCICIWKIIVVKCCSFCVAFWSTI